jgi:hypothetical protein
MTTTDKQPATDVQAGYADALIKRVTAENGIDYAYRDLGAGEVPLVLLQHFRGNARLKIYPDSAHGFLFQHHSQFAADVDGFLAAAG